MELGDLILIDGLPYSRSELAGMLQKWLSRRTEEDVYRIVDTIEQNLVSKLNKNNTVRHFAKHKFSELVGEVLAKVDQPGHMRMQADLAE